MEVLTLNKIFIVAISLLLILAIDIGSLTAAQNSKPTLEGGAILYTLKDNQSTYRVIVTYKDADGDLPKYMFVYLNESRRAMVKVDEKDLNPKDGIVYTLQMTNEEFLQFTKGKNELKYYFRTNDGRGVVTTAESSSLTLDYEQMGLSMEHSSGSGGKCGR